jgi:hypothetical protein
LESSDAGRIAKLNFCSFKLFTGIEQSESLKLTSQCAANPFIRIFASHGLRLINANVAETESPGVYSYEVAVKSVKIPATA